VENASDARLLYMSWACQLAVVFNSELVMGAAQVICRKLACCSGKSVAVICLQEVDMWQCAGWALVKLLLPCVGCCANAGESALVLPYGSASDMVDEWFSQKGGDTFLMVFKSRWRLLGFDLSTINALG
jgi:hypothetical protein